ncbi:hypothetical protein M752DRAFT_14291 [Aspergillus phoenicis ATCC 13157]|uniref:Uncharacterized protein n=1 Tax=Aspergillus phoenicis ATCC 13157 TaxID=1353007 RepID=A0A370Q1L2_ASPPH|nr:hypothetical protein M752DRAFT_14291 [Aspergillus phoenicis ATCC 13157]
MATLKGHKTRILLRGAVNWHLEAIILLILLSIPLSFHHYLPYVPSLWSAPPLAHHCLPRLPLPFMPDCFLCFLMPSATLQAYVGMHIVQNRLFVYLMRGI